MKPKGRKKEKLLPAVGRMNPAVSLPKDIAIFDPKIDFVPWKIPWLFYLRKEVE